MSDNGELEELIESLTMDRVIEGVVEDLSGIEEVLGKAEALFSIKEDFSSAKKVNEMRRSFHSLGVKYANKHSQVDMPVPKPEEGGSNG